MRSASGLRTRTGANSETEGRLGVTHKWGRAAVAALAVGAMTLGVGAVADEKTDSVAQRQAVMKSIGTHFGAIKGILQGGGDVTAVSGHAAAISNLVAVVPTMFPEGTSLEDGFDTEAKANIWSDREGFLAAAEKAQTEAAKLAEIAKGGDVQATTAQFAATGKEGCSGCHSTFRQKDN